MGMMSMRHPFFFRPEDCGTMMPLSAATLMVHGFPLESYGLLAHPKDGLLWMSGKEKTGRDATFQEESFRLAVTKGEIKSCCQADFPRRPKS